MKISNQPPKGTADWLPAEFKIRQYVFNAWRRVCLRYGYEEYLTPLVEAAEIYRAKSGEDVGGQESATFTDLGGRELSIRPEMTPSVVRLVSRIYEAAPKPLRYFSIANFMRNEKPQRGRNREFWQLNCDIFGSDSAQADREIIQLALDLMLEFKPPKNSFVLGISSRKLVEALFQATGLRQARRVEFFRVLDKYHKLSQIDFQERLKILGLAGQQLSLVRDFMSGQARGEWFKKAYREIEELIKALTALGYGQYVEFNPTVIRGFDYYDGLVFEVFDRHPDNNRSLFGGGRYNGLAGLFGAKSFPAVGFAPGDEPLRLFLASWKLMPKDAELGQPIWYLPLLDGDLTEQVWVLAKTLRAAGRAVVLGLEEQKISKALALADKQGWAKTVILGQSEAAAKHYKIKDMESGRETVAKL